MRILIWTNAAFANTGYGIQARHMARAFNQLGHPTAIATNFGLMGNSLDWKGIRHYPRWRAALGEDAIEVHAKDWKADAVLSLYDIWTLNPNNIKSLLPCPWIAMIPVDGAPLSSKMRAVASQADHLIAYSKFGRDEARKAGLDCRYIPHGIDTTVFKPPKDRMARYKIRDQIGLPRESFLISVIAANKGYPCRKGWPELLEAFAHFQSEYTDAKLYLHTTNMPFGSRGEGIDIKGYLNFLGVPASAFKMIEEAELARGVSEEHLVGMYHASNVLLLPSMGEGFGLPVPEAQACGTPVIVQNASAQAELCFNGLAIEPLQHMWMPQLGYYWQLPSIKRIIHALEMLYHEAPSPEYWQVQAYKAVERIREDYSWQHVVQRYWRLFLDKVEATLW